MAQAQQILNFLTGRRISLNMKAMERILKHLIP
jgi:hypothetical protein